MLEKGPQSFDQRKKLEAIEKNLEQLILEGKVLDIIPIIGWERFREKLKDMNYADIIKTQIQRIEQLEQQPKEDIPKEVIEHENMEAMKRAKELQRWYIENYPEEGGATFFGEPKDQIDKKVFVVGKRIDPKGVLTRIYIASPSMNTPEIFRRIVERLIDNRVMSKILAALNLEAYQGDSLRNVVENNNIILYIPGSDSGVLTKAIRSVNEAKQSDPERWELPPHAIAKLIRGSLFNLMIPLDCQVYFVEQEDYHKSYHADIWGYLFEEIFGISPSYLDRDPEGRWDLNKLAEKLSMFSKQRPGLLKRFPRRRRYMPGLVF